jgi:galactosamine-6-phosphate isomerase
MHPHFRTHVAPSHQAQSQAAAQAVTDLLRRRPDALLVLATGATPELTYRILADRGRAEPALFARARLLKLDEWGGLAMDDPATCEDYLRRVLVEPLGIGPDRFFGFNSQPADASAECARMAAWLHAHGPADMAVLGLGVNGHLGFNEPADFLQPGPHRAELSAESKGHGMIQVARGTPEYGLTLGMRDLLACRQILLLVSGSHKRLQVQRLMQPEITPRFPGSFLWLHPAVELLCDDDAWPGRSSPSPDRTGLRPADGG